MAIRASLSNKPSAAVSAGRSAAGSFATRSASTTRVAAAPVHRELAEAVATATATLRAAALGSASGIVEGLHHAASAVAVGAHAGQRAWMTFAQDLARYLIAHAPHRTLAPRAPRRPRRVGTAPKAATPVPGAKTSTPRSHAAWPATLLATAPHMLFDHLGEQPQLAGKLPRVMVTSTTAPLYGVAAGMADSSLHAAWAAVCLRTLFFGGGQYFRGIVPLSDEPRRRPKTMSRREMLRERRRRERAGEMLEIASYERPLTRADCIDGPRPCLFVACKHHLYLDVNPETGSIKINFPDRDVWELDETCALDVAERGGVTLEEVGDILNLTRERVRQVEVTGLTKLKGESPQHELDVFVGWDPHPEEF